MIEVNKSMLTSDKIGKICIATLLLLVAVLAVVSAPASADGYANFNDSLSYHNSRILMQYDVNSNFTLPKYNGTDLLRVIEDYSDLVPGMLCVEFTVGASIKDEIKYLCSLDGVLWAEPDYVSVEYPKGEEMVKIDKETYLTKGIAQDRVYVMYFNESYTPLPWDIIYKRQFYTPIDSSNPDGCLIYYKIPDGMTLKEGVSYCENLGLDVEPASYLLDASNNYASTFYEHIIEIWYKPNATYALPWTIVKGPIVDDPRDPVIYFVQIPKDVTIFDAVKEALTYEDVIDAYIASTMVTTASSSYIGNSVQPVSSTSSPLSPIVIVSGVVVAIAIGLLGKRE